MTQHLSKNDKIDLRHCFVEHTGNVWKVKTLIKAASTLKAHEFDLSSISLEDPIRWHMNNVRDALAHLDRLRRADTSLPIIQRADGCIMNGWHRIIKAMSEGKKSIPAKIFIENPKPDFVLPLDHPAVLRI